MGKKTYHIVDPETGEVVGEKRLGRLGQAYYKTPPRERPLFLLTLVLVFLMLASAVLCVVYFFVPENISSFLFWTMIAIAVLVVILGFLWSVLDAKRAKADADGGRNE